MIFFLVVMFNFKFSKLIYALCIFDMAGELSTFSCNLHETLCSVFYETKMSPFSVFK